MPTHEPHELCALFPNLDEAEYNALRDSIAAVGLLEPITRLDGQILDGLHRYRACCELGIAATFVEFAGADPLEFVLARNLHRRHLTPAQRAGIAALALTLDASHCRAVSNGIKHLPANAQVISEVAAPESRSVPTAEAVHRAATAAKVSDRQVYRAKSVAQADRDLIQQVVDGTVSLPAAVERVTGKRPGKRPAKQSADADRVRELEEELELVRDGAQEAVAQAEAAREVLNGDPAKAILRLREQLRVTELRRDELMRENAELKREVKRLQRKLGIRQ